MNDKERDKSCNQTLPTCHVIIHVITLCILYVSNSAGKKLATIHVVLQWPAQWSQAALVVHVVERGTGDELFQK